MSDEQLFNRPSPHKILYTKNALHEYSPIGTSKDFTLAIAMREVHGYDIVDKFGENPDVDSGSTPEDITGIGGVYNFGPSELGTAPIVSIISSNTNDNQIVRVEGLNINGEYITQRATLNGTNRVALETPLFRSFVMENESDTEMQGDVYVYEGTATGGAPALADRRALISNGNGRTLMCVYTIPVGKVGFLLRGEIGVSRGNTGAEVRVGYFSRRYGATFTIKKRVNLSVAGSSIYQDERPIPDIIPSLTDIKITVEDTSSNGIGIFGTLVIILIDEKQYSDELLAAIGQYGY